MIQGMHVTLFTPEAEALRAFIRDKLRFPSSDVGGGWLIFDVPEAELACHDMDPDDASGGEPGKAFQLISFYCDSLEDTVAELEERGIEFASGIADRGYARVTHFQMPGGIAVELYEPHYQKQSSPSG